MSTLAHQYKSINLKVIQSSRDNFKSFVQYIKDDYEVKEFHEAIMQYLDMLQHGIVKKVMINVPPQHGKSELSSRLFPAYLLGKNPKSKIALCSYGAEHAQAFNRDVQRVIDTDRYKNVFPKTYLNESNVSGSSLGSWKRTANIFETVGYGGFLKTVGVGGALTGTTVDIGIVDDVYKDKEEAYSKTIRDKVLNWYNYVFASRLHNDSKQLILFTRWHDDDLAKQLLDRDGTDWKKDGWMLVVFQSIKEDGVGDEMDNRKTGEALWPERHSFARLNKIKETDPLVFSSLYQQRPTLLGGNIVQRNWFGWYDPLFLDKIDTVNHFYIDTATSSKEQKNNDPSGILSGCLHTEKLYLTGFMKGLFSFPELCQMLIQANEMLGTHGQSISFIENKSNGASLKQTIERETGLNVKLENPKRDKISRLHLQTARIMVGKVMLPIGASWVIDFIDIICRFPTVTHDEEVDCLTGLMRCLFEKNNRKKWTGQDFGIQRK